MPYHLGCCCIPVKNCQGGWVVLLKTHWLYYTFSCLPVVFSLGLDQEIEIVEGECTFLLQFSQMPVCVSNYWDFSWASQTEFTQCPSLIVLLPEGNGNHCLGTSVVLCNLMSLIRPSQDRWCCVQESARLRTFLMPLSLNVWCTLIVLTFEVYYYLYDTSDVKIQIQDESSPFSIESLP